MSGEYTCIIAEDQLLYRNQLVEYCIKFGFKVLDTVTSGKQLIESALRHMPDVIFTDITLNRVDGLTACQKLQQQGVQASIIIISNSTQPFHYCQGFELGSVDYMNKPLSEERFEKGVQRVKRKIEEQRTLAQLQYHKAKMIRVKHKYRDIELNEEKVMFVEKLDKRLFHIYMTDGVIIETSTNLEQIKNQCSDQFFSSHRSYLVNIQHIHTVLPDPIIKGNYEIYFSLFSKSVQLTRRNYPIYMQLRNQVKSNGETHSPPSHGSKNIPFQ